MLFRSFASHPDSPNQQPDKVQVLRGMTAVETAQRLKNGLTGKMRMCSGCRFPGTSPLFYLKMLELINGGRGRQDAEVFVVRTMYQSVAQGWILLSVSFLLLSRYFRSSMNMHSGSVKRATGRRIRFIRAGASQLHHVDTLAHSESVRPCTCRGGRLSDTFRTLLSPRNLPADARHHSQLALYRRGQQGSLDVARTGRCRGKTSRGAFSHGASRTPAPRRRHRVSGRRYRLAVGARSLDRGARPTELKLTFLS